MKINFIHNAFHNMSKSSQFMIDILVQLGHDVRVLNREDFENWKHQIPDLYVLWQADRLLPEVETFEKPILCIPMLDDALPLTVSHYRKFESVKFVSFSKTLHKFLLLSGCRSSYIQYWPKIEATESVKENHIYFWERNPSHFSIEDLARATETSNVKIYLRQQPDPHDQLEERLRIVNPRVEMLPVKWSTKSDYKDKVARSLVFVSPRPWEGIGMSFLEAMAMGCCVIAFNNPTMNEYIKSGETGILINHKNSKIDLTNAREIGQKARAKSTLGSYYFESNAQKFFLFAIDDAFKHHKRKRLKFLPGWLTLRRYIFVTTLLRHLTFKKSEHN
jgi:hypothetical protein